MMSFVNWYFFFLKEAKIVAKPASPVANDRIEEEEQPRPYLHKMFLMLESVPQCPVKAVKHCMPCI